MKKMGKLSLMDKIDNKKNILNNIINTINSAYKDSIKDRRIIHELEWNASDDTPSILGEVEVISDNIIGHVQTYLDWKIENVEDVINFIKSNSIFASNILVSWIIGESDKYKNYLTYLYLIELLRITFENILKDSVDS